MANPPSSPRSGPTSPITPGGGGNVQPTPDSTGTFQGRAYLKLTKDGSNIVATSNKIDAFSFKTSSNPFWSINFKPINEEGTALKDIEINISSLSKQIGGWNTFKIIIRRCFDWCWGVDSREKYLANVLKSIKQAQAHIQSSGGSGPPTPITSPLPSRPNSEVSIDLPSLTTALPPIEEDDEAKKSSESISKTDSERGREDSVIPPPQAGIIQKHVDTPPAEVPAGSLLPSTIPETQPPVVTVAPPPPPTPEQIKDAYSKVAVFTDEPPNVAVAEPKPAVVPTQQQPLDLTKTPEPSKVPNLTDAPKLAVNSIVSDEINKQLDDDNAVSKILNVLNKPDVLQPLKAYYKGKFPSEISKEDRKAIASVLIRDIKQIVKDSAIGTRTASTETTQTLPMSSKRKKPARIANIGDSDTQIKKGVAKRVNMELDLMKNNKDLPKELNDLIDNLLK